jgi:hypothetical protein
VVCQHFNDSDSAPARFIAVMPNLIEALGVDLGSRFEQLEDAPQETPRERERGSGTP